MGKIICQDRVKALYCVVESATVKKSALMGFKDMGLGKGGGIGGNKGCGKPRQWDTDVAEVLLELMREGMSIRQLGQSMDMPSTNTIWEWTHGRLGAPTSFRNDYESARRAQGDAFAQQTIGLAEIMDDAVLRAQQEALDELPDDASPADKRKAVFYAKRRSIEATKLQISTRQWAAGRMNRAKWGDHVALQHSTDPESPPRINFQNMTDEQLEKLAHLEEELGGSPAA